MARSRGRLAPESMDTMALWRAVHLEMQWFQDFGIRGAAFHDKERHFKRLDACLIELSLRGIQGRLDDIRAPVRSPRL
ncbi:MAG: hypothetical protein ABSE84_25785 [Isosphaeraceae bacterium]|jgi:hypothetical protein